MFFLSSIKLQYSRTVKSDDGHAISRQEKMAFSTPVGLSWDSPPPPTESVQTDGRTDGWSRDYYVTTKISWIDSLPNFLSNGAPLAGFARRLRYYTAADQAIINVHGCIYSVKLCTPICMSWYCTVCNTGAKILYYSRMPDTKDILNQVQHLRQNIYI